MVFKENVRKNKYKVAVVGLGHQSVDDHIPAVLESQCHELVAVCDTNEETLNKVSLNFEVDGFSSSKDLLASIKPDMVIMAVPHSEYLSSIKQYASKGVHIIKEKPFATTIKEALEIDSVIQKSNVFFGLTLQRRFNPIFMAFNQLRHRIGKIYLVDGMYGFNIDRLDDGWRAKNNFSGGGALMDMGYHFIDLLVWYMGVPDATTARITRGNREGQQYDVEDTASLMFEYSSPSYSEKTLGRFLISRVHPRKEESIVFYGTKGSIKIERGRIVRFDIGGGVVDVLERKDGWSSAACDQLMYFTRVIEGDNSENYSYREHFKHVSIISDAYESDFLKKSVDSEKNYSSLLKRVGL